MGLKEIFQGPSPSQEKKLRQCSDTELVKAGTRRNREAITWAIGGGFSLAGTLGGAVASVENPAAGIGVMVVGGVITMAVIARAHAAMNEDESISQILKERGVQTVQRKPDIDMIER